MGHDRISSTHNFPPNNNILSEKRTHQLTLSEKRKSQIGGFLWNNQNNMAQPSDSYRSNQTMKEDLSKVQGSCYVVETSSDTLQSFHYSATGAGGEIRSFRSEDSVALHEPLLTDGV